MHILVADDHALFRMGMEMIVKSTLQAAHLVFGEEVSIVPHNKNPNKPHHWLGVKNNDLRAIA